MGHDVAWNASIHRIKMTVVDVNALRVRDLHGLSTGVGDTGRVIGLGFGNREGKAATGVDVTVENVCDGVACLLTGKACPNLTNISFSVLVVYVTPKLDSPHRSLQASDLALYREHEYLQH